MKSAIHGKILCKYSELLPISELKLNPKNPNKHTSGQLEYYCKILKQGIRKPVRVSNLSGFVTAGHGQIEASIKNGWTYVPVEYQDYDSPEAEYADMVADNTLARMSDIDFAMVNIELPDLGPDFDLELLAIPGFTIDRSERLVSDPSKEWVGMPEFNQGDKTSFRHVVIHFRDHADAEAFFKKLEYPDTGKTRSLWYPPQENLDTETRRYAEGE